VTRNTYLDTARGLLTRQDPKQFLFFTRTPNGRRAGKEFLARLAERTSDRDQAISVRSFRAQLKAIHRWGQQQPADLASVRQPVLLMNGDSDKMVPTKNTVDSTALPNSQFVIYPDARHAWRVIHEDFVGALSSSYERCHEGVRRQALRHDGLRARRLPGRGRRRDVLVRVMAASTRWTRWYATANLSSS
jgi:pimeloyl-ACP methyl ester carboxylesterase